MSCETCSMSRRDFVSAATLASVAAVLAACGGEGAPTQPGGGGGGGGATTGPLVVRIGDHPGLSSNLTPVLVSGSVAAVRTAPGQFLAFSRACTHEGTPVNLGGEGFVCPNHGSRFDAQGNVTTGPAPRALNRLAVTYDATANTLTITT